MPSPILILPILLLISLPSYHTYGGLGHALTGVIASQLLTLPEFSTFQKFIDFMAKNYTNVATFGEAARFSDDIRSNTSDYDTWHYMQKCYSSDQITRCSAVRAPNSFTVLCDSIDILKNSSEPFEKKAFYFMFLMHLMGDIHQPLHNIRLFSQNFPRGDSGGNAIPIKYQGILGNLHEFWDNLCIMKPVNPSRPFTKYPKIKASLEILASQYIANNTFSVNEVEFKGNYSRIEEWMNEGYGLAIKYAYEPSVVTDGNLTDAYAGKCRQVVDRQIALAGFRMANVMKYLHGFIV